MRLTLIVLAGLLLPRAVDATVAGYLPALGPACLEECETQARYHRQLAGADLFRCATLANMAHPRGGHDFAVARERCTDAHRDQLAEIDEALAACRAHCGGRGCHGVPVPATRSLPDPLPVPSGGMRPFAVPVPVMP